MSNVDTDPVGFHLDEIQAWVTEAAGDMGLEEDYAYHDVAMSYLHVECPPELRREVCRRLGLDPGPEVLRQWKEH